MSFVYDYGGKIATQVSGKWKGTLDSPKAIAGLTAYKHFFDAASRAPKTTDEAHPNPYDVYAQGHAGLDGRRRLVQLLRRRQVQELDGAVRDAEPHRRASRCRASSAAPTSPSRSARTRRSRVDWISAFTEQRVDDRAAGDRQHPEHDRLLGHAASTSAPRAKLVRPDREELGQRREREHPPHDAVADPHRASSTRQAGGAVASDNITLTLNQ